MSYILTQLITIKMPEWNTYIPTEADVDSISYKLRVPIIDDMSAKAKGEYLLFEDVTPSRPMILIRPDVKKSERLWVIFHEIGHHLLHYPVPHKFSKSLQRKMDREANFFAAIALIPTFLIVERLIIYETLEAALGSIKEDYNYPKELLIIRKYIYEEYKI